MDKDSAIYVRHMLDAIANIEADIIPWRAIAGIGNVLRHDYHDTYPTVLWDTCQKDLMPLKDAVVRIGRVVAGTKRDANDTK